ncbi:MAG: hypothetical protein QOI04_1765 [Verrucomicrobiota bacterium]|jgi:hypothetical protein
MDSGLKERRGETAAHRRLKRLALIWAQAQGYAACAMEVSLPRCRYRADVAAFRAEKNNLGSTIIFECKQALADLRRDNCCSDVTRARLASIQKRREVLEKHLRVHYPNLRNGDSLFPEFASHDFMSIQHRGYARVLRELGALQNKLFGSTKFEQLLRYRCADLFYLVLPNELVCESELPLHWGVLVEKNDGLEVLRKPVRQQTTSQQQLHFLQRIARAGTRNLNRALEITFEEVAALRQRQSPLANL